jgi:hypothetical protein
MLQLNYGYAPINLNDFSSVKEKLDATIAYIEINTIFCQLQDGQTPDVLSPVNYNVVDMLVPGGNPVHIKSILLDVLTILAGSLEEYVYNYEDHYEIGKTLEVLKDKCISLSKKNDVYKSLPYKENKITWFAVYKGGRYQLFFRQLILDETVRNEFSDHFSIRKEFFDEMIEMIDKKLLEHLEIPTYPKTPYKWESENPHLEIAELLHAIMQIRVKIKEGEKGSNSKLAKEFYNLFGLDDGLFHSKLQQIRKRQNKKSWLQELPDYINSLQDNVESSKKKP